MWEQVLADSIALAKESENSQDSAPSSPGSISKAETKFYYAGLYSSPELVYRSSTRPWTMPTGPDQMKSLRPVYAHKIDEVWDSELAPKVLQLLKENDLRWTTIDIVRFKVGDEPTGPVVLWIGVAPDTVTTEEARISSDGCLELLRQFGIEDVEVEFRTSVYFLLRSVGPGLSKPVFGLHTTVDVGGPLTPVVGLSIAAQDTSHAEGTGGLYLAEGGGSKNILLLTARHVIFPSNEGSNIDYTLTDTSAPRHNVLLGPHTFDDLEKRVIGHVVHSPPITTDAVEGFTEDYAVVKLDIAKLKNTFKGNVMDLGASRIDLTKGVFENWYTTVGTKIPASEFAFKMCPCADAATSFKYPDDRLLPLQGIMSEELMRKPDMLDHDGEACLFVIKNGNTTGVTIGRATGVYSYVREDLSNNTQRISKEWAILPFDKKSGVFSDRGDSGSIIVDGHGQIGGLLTGGAGETEFLDMTYATPFFWLLPRIKANGFPNAHLDPQNS